MSREAVMEALFARLCQSGDYVSTSRRNRRPETFKPEETPALMLVEATERYRSASPMLPSIRRLMVKAIVYSDVGTDQNAIPATIINGLLDGIDAALEAEPGTGKCTLGGLVDSVVIEGDIVKAPGDVTGKSLAVVPIAILLP